MVQTFSVQYRCSTAAFFSRLYFNDFVEKKPNLGRSRLNIARTDVLKMFEQNFLLMVSHCEKPIYINEQQFYKRENKN